MGGIGDALGQIGQATGVSNIGQGIHDLFTGGSQAMTPDQMAGAVMPSGSLFGMPTAPKAAIAPTPSPNFLQGFAQGFMGMTPGQGADFPMSPGAQVASGVGQLFHAINTLRNPQQLVAAGLKQLATGGNAPGADGGTDAAANVANALMPSDTLFGAPVPPVNMASGPPLQGPESVASYHPAASHPGLIHSIISGLTFGLLDNPSRYMGSS